MKDITHICCSESGIGIIKYAIKKGMLSGKNVLYFFDDLSNGPISDTNYEEERISWNKELHQYEDSDFFEEIRAYYHSFHKSKAELHDEDIYLWYGQNPKEICALMYTLPLLKSKLESIYLINVSEMVYEVKHGYKYSPMKVGEVATEKLIDFLPLKKILDYDTYSAHVEQWTDLKKQNSSLRTIKDKRVVSVKEDYFDEMILKYTSKEYAPCARTVGEVMGRSEQCISDTFIFWRILEYGDNIKEKKGTSNARRNKGAIT